MFTLIDLPYSPDALAPVISAETIAFHHGKHLQAYVDNLNKLIAGTKFESMSLEDIFIRAGKVGGGLFNNAGQVLNHNMYFTQFQPSEAAKHEPTGALKAQIEAQWGTVDAFKEDFVAKGVSLFGSGWVWLSVARDGSLVISQEPCANNPLYTPQMSMWEAYEEYPEIIYRPLLTFDVWEHAYYLDYQNRRAAHLDALWSIVDWQVIENRYEDGLGFFSNAR